MTPATAVLVLPTLAAVLYVFGAMLVKRASDLGVGLWRTTFVVNVISGAVFSLLWLHGGPAVDVSLLWQPALIALCLFAGQIAQFLALERGDVTVAVPVFGLKVVLVAFFTPFLTADSVDARLWIAAVLSVMGLTFLNRKDASKPPQALGVTFAAGGVCAVCFAVFDVLVQKWGPAWGAAHLLPCIYWMNALLSFTLITRFKAPLRAVRREAWPWLTGGAVLLGMQSVTFVSTLAIYGRATSANVVYASRGLLSVVVVWMIGHWFSSTEQHLGARVLRWRLLGAMLMMSAIVLVVTR